MRNSLLSLLAASMLLTSPSVAQIERVNDASLLLRAASFGASMNTAITYQLVEYEPGRWIVHAQYSPPSATNWLVLESPMSGPGAGYVKFANGERETIILDVLKIDSCYGTTGEVRVGW